MNALSISYPGALIAGVLSFASPCVLPLVPAYLAFLSGVSIEEASAHQGAAVSRRLIFSSLAFVLGFITVFVLLGASATFFSRVLADHIGVLSKIAGTIIIIFGLQYIGVLRIPFLYREARFHPQTTRPSLISAYLIGLAFAFGWTPCVGPVLATILTLAAQSSSIGHGILLLLCYGIGIGIPFLIAAAAVGPFMRAAAHVRSAMKWVEYSLGAIMIVTGALIVLGSIANIGGWLFKTFPAFGRIG